MQKYPMTVVGHAALEAELKQLKNIERPEIIQAISVVREHGDLSENAEYHAAKEKQGFIEGRIQELESKLSLSQVIDVSKMDSDKVTFGATVKIVNEDTDEESSYQIVGEDEADVKLNLISIGSPIARALIGKEEGDVVVVASNNGSDKDPIWWLNLQAQPRVTIQLGRNRYTAEAVALEEPARSNYWPKIVAINPRQAQYQAQSARQLPVILLRRVD